MVYVITVHLHANDHPDSVDKIKAKLIEASRVYSKDKETLSWFVSQSTSDPRDFTIVERYEKESVSSKMKTQPCTFFVPQREYIMPPTQKGGGAERHTHTYSIQRRKRKQVINTDIFSHPPYRARSITSRTHTGRLLTPTSSPSSTGPWTCDAQRSSTPARTSSCRLRYHTHDNRAAYIKYMYDQ